MYLLTFWGTQEASLLTDGGTEEKVFLGQLLNDSGEGIGLGSSPVR